MANLTRTGQARDPAGAVLIAALENAWAAIRRTHGEVPPAMLITGSGSGARSLRLGHFAAERWRRADADGTLPEIFVGGEGLARGAGPVFATLLHEAAHALAHVRGIKGTSRQGRYHNRRFKTLAEELGLLIEQAPAIGWSVTTLPRATGDRYAAVIAELDNAITVYRRREAPADGSPGPGAASTVACLCACPRRIRVAPGVLARGPIVCAVCCQPFSP